MKGIIGGWENINPIYKLLSGTKENSKKKKNFANVKQDIVFLSTKVKTLGTGAVILSNSEKGDLDLSTGLLCLSLNKKLAGIRNVFPVMTSE